MKKKLFLSTTIFIILMCISFFARIVDLIVNIEWYKEVGYISVYFTKLVAIIKLMIPIFLISFIGIWLYYKSLRLSIIKYKKVVEVNSEKNKIEKRIFFTSNLIISLIISYAFSAAYWYRILQFTNSVKFNIKDPIFNIDISFYVFKLPLIQSIYGAMVSLLGFLVFITFITYSILSAKDKIYSTKNIKRRFSRINLVNGGLTRFAGKQLAIISALIMVCVSIGYMLKAFGLVYSPRGVAFGASYTDVHVSMLFYKIIVVVSLIAAIVIFTSVLASKVKPIVASIGLIVILVITEGVASNAVQTFLVKSNEKTLEQPYIKYNIDYTRKAFNIEDIQAQPFEVKDNLTKEDINNNKDTIDNIRVNSYNPALEFYNQVQIIRYYYGFNDVDVDRYNVNNKSNQVFVAAREINSQAIDPSTWQNKHLIYTHGYGVVMSKVNSVTSEGQPDFVIKDMPPQNSTNIDLENSRIYFGEKTDDYAIVNTKMNEFDYPKGGDNQTNKYDGKAGIKMSFMSKILFAANQGDLNFLLSRDITSESKILINRNIVDRVKKIAPFLSYDSDPYIVISNGRLYWVIDAYTSSDKYPFSQIQSNINYIRNSVKVVIDAYDGNTDFYLVDKNDPIAISYSKIFPGLFKDTDKLSNDIKQHFKYPEDLFTIQCNILGKYHVTDPGVFYNGEDLWEVSKNQKQVEGEKDASEAPYVVMKLPGEKNEEMVVIQYFNMRNKDNMVALFGARMDGENYGKMVLYKFPPQKTVYSPYLFKQKLNQDTAISKELSLWNKGDSQVQFGDTIIVPINNSLLYVEPMYLRASGKNSIPEMKRVIVSYGENIILAENIESALEQMFNYKQEDKGINQSNVSSGNSAEKLDKIKQVKEVYDKALEAQKNGDWAKYGEYIKQLGEMITELNK
ncbi:UPF0182 family protein [Clostridium magnum]|uniref:UPF0182 protein CLMAG_62700 n=1 Tax=Clostridium magnum DSM 2767 TaxID=1121326 RepID=A0A162QD71_9CLOT|nr:UPF0182 family protein [Clostridium magnum]KZL88415.1 hypothetical protein CLMAG_62700 [Clostridium magnum DSM 2767]SHJ26377.1 hypothetical protein SAMN02745944_05630 [Clostridium magnum DSM 2767]